MKKQRKSGTAHYFFLVYIIKEEKISDAWFGTPAYCIETTVKTGRIFKIGNYILFYTKKIIYKLLIYNITRSF